MQNIFKKIRNYEKNSLILFVLMAFSFCSIYAKISTKPRIINMTDLGADVDDQESMIRFLVQSNEYDVEGLIVTTSCWKKTQSNTNMLIDLINAYGNVLSNLRVHSLGFPSVEHLKSVSVLGQQGYGMNDVGLGKDSPGSNLIISAVDKNDSRPIWICFWGGGNTLAQALWKVQNTRSAAELQKFINKIRVYDVLGQDAGGTWIAKTFPNLLYIRATSVYGWQPKNNWFIANVQNHGSLGAAYPTRKWAWEGDTPAFLHIFPNGLNNPDEPWQGGWGGRFDRTKKAGIRGMSGMAGEDAPYDIYYMFGNSSVQENSKWSTGLNNDFQARMDWANISDYASANHHPIAIINGDKTKRVLKIDALAGTNVQLNAAESYDLDNNSLTYNWFFYKEPGTYNGTVTIQGGTTASPTIQIPSDANGKEIHIVLELKDEGSPNLYSYRRMIINATNKVNVLK